MMNKKKILKELNECLKLMDKRVTEGSVNTQIELVSNMIKKDYSIDEDFDKDIDTLKKISDYNVRRKVLRDLVKKYVR
jgi:hypothetical protein